MAYFDSPKNRAIWEAELEDLRKMKADFTAGKLPDTSLREAEKNRDEIHRKPVSYEQLVKEEAQASAPSRKPRAESMERKQEKNRTKAPELRKPSTENGR